MENPQLLPSSLNYNLPHETLQRYFIQHLFATSFEKSNSKALAADLRLPHEVFTTARSFKRKIILHCGPTNSGKTYNAMNRLIASKSGIYCGPLRMMAMENRDKLVASGVKCNLLTGQERERVDGAQHVSCTVEMLDHETFYDCAVVDEIQMIGDQSRGDGFTRALLGVAAAEVHLCGDPSVVDLVTELCHITKDELQVKRYERLASLSVVDPIGSEVYAQAGDCIICFSRKEIYAVKKLIEMSTEAKVCVIYGSLPPESRKAQASLFNDPTSGYDILVASDAIGMGLNLNIKRVVFSTMQKYDGIEERKLVTSEILQIAGRAGRYKSIYPEGSVTTVHKSDLGLLVRALARKVPPTKEQAGLRPSVETLTKIHTKLPELSFVEVLEHSNRFAVLDGKYFLCDMSDFFTIASLLDRIPMTLEDKYTFCGAPADGPTTHQYLKSWALMYSEEQPVRMDLVLPNTTSSTSVSRLLKDLEDVHKLVSLYIWLCFRFPSNFVDLDKALTLCDHTTDAIESLLDTLAKENNTAVFSKRVHRRTVNRGRLY